MAKICLTYSRRDEDVAREIADVLEVVAYDVRPHAYDNRDAPWTGEPLASALADADHWLVVLSANAVGPELVQQRIEAAGKGEKPVVAVVVGSTVPMDWSMRLPEIPVVDIGADPEAGFEELLATLRPTYEQIRGDYDARVAVLEDELKATLTAAIDDESIGNAERLRRITAACYQFQAEEAAFWQNLQLKLFQHVKEVEKKQYQINARVHALHDDRMRLYDLLISGQPPAKGDRLAQRLQSHSARPLVIPPDLHDRLRAVLLACDQFGSHRELRAIFSDSRLTPWQHGLPEADSVSARVDAIIGYLRDKRSRYQESALVLLLRVLSQRYQDSLHDRLEELAGKLENVRKRQLLAQLEDENNVLAGHKRLLSAELSALTELVETVREGSQDKAPAYAAAEEVMSIVAAGERQALEQLLKGDAG